jgi:serine/threonine-protein kinase
VTPERIPARPEALDAALAVQLDRLERMTLRALQVLTAFGLVLSLFLALTTASGLGAACATISGVLFTWFFVFERILAHGPTSPVLRGVNTFVESSGPWMFLALIAMGEGPLYALSSWVPPLTFCILIVVYTARLRPRACLVLGATSALLYAAIYVLYFRPHLPSAPMLLTRPMTQISRMLLLLFAGILGALVARGVRQAFARAESQVREQDLFGKYRLVRRIASGGMGMVFEALYCPEGGFERRVAVKRIHPHLAADKKFVDAFRDEAELSARLAHPGIVQVLDFGRIGDSFFLAMEHVDGMTLNALVVRTNRKKKKLSAAIVAHVLRSVLGALAYAHEGARGPDGRPLRVVHRDLCPPNVLVSRIGEVKLTDFGIARSLSDAGTSMTKSITGHVGYMAPEQARAAPFDVRADLFPVGVMAWELFTLRPCFRKDNEAASLNALLYEDVPPVSIARDDVDKRWSIWIERAMARDPAARYASAIDMLAALDVIPESRAAEGADELAHLVEELLRHDDREDPLEEPTQDISDRDPTTQISS